MDNFLSQKQTTPRQLVTVVTRLKTLNVGNEALSSELIRLAQNKLSNYKICALVKISKIFRPILHTVTT
jgi:hypothetical protein